MHKGNFIDHFFVSSCGEISQLISGTLGIPCYGYQKVWYQLRENFGVYLHAKKIEIIPPFFLEMLRRYCKLVILHSLRCNSIKKTIVSTYFIPHFFLEILNFPESDWLILAYNLGTRILPDKEFVVKYK